MNEFYEWENYGDRKRHQHSTSPFSMPNSHAHQRFVHWKKNFIGAATQHRDTFYIPWETSRRVAFLAFVKLLLKSAQVKSSNDEYTRRMQNKCSYYKFYGENGTSSKWICF
ncbi:uncharacterized protein LOC122577446 [Bombus pyrosoma]|uniref:uncharacterized protein LOC122577446 n=1 Tax=Bombus pyrosoma TaxID=396416 RepID=UPI001CB9A40A|nr:uncharacterized protein LOC122577446 [Bombus pyrosoma]